MNINRRSSLCLVTLLAFLLQGCGSGSTSSTNTTPTTPEPEKVPLNITLTGPEQVIEQSQVTLDVQRQGDGTIVSYHWQQTSGPEIQLDSDDQPSLTYSAPTVMMDDGPQTVVVKLTVVTADSQTVSDDIATVIEPVNEAPQVLSAESHIVEGHLSTITLNAVDTDGSIEKVEWQQTAGPQIDFIAGTPGTIEFMAPTVTALQPIGFSATVWDNEHSSTLYQFDSTITSKNQFPLAPSLLLDSSEVSVRVYSPIYADWNNDGIDDVVTIDYLKGSPAIYYYQNKGDGTFITPARHLLDLPFVFTQGDLPPALINALDITGDGTPEILISGNAGDGLRWLDLTQSDPAVHMIDTDEYSRFPLEIVDIDADGFKDIVCAEDNGQMLWYRNLGNGSFDKQALLYDSPQQNTFGSRWPVAFADVNNDGHVDMITVVGYDLPKLEISWGQGNGQMNPITLIDISVSDTLPPLSPMNPSSVTVEDLDNNGFADVVVTSINDSFRVYMNQGEGVFSEWFPQQIRVSATDGTVADLDHDGIKEIYMLDRSVLAQQNGNHVSSPNLMVVKYPVQADASLSLASQKATANSLTLVQFDSDEQPELAMYFKSEHSLFYLDTQTEMVKKAVTRDRASHGFTQVLSTLTTDLNQDGLDDLITLGDNNLSIWYGPISPAQTASDHYPVWTEGLDAGNSEFASTQLFDWDKDGLPDIVIALANQLKLLKQKPDHSFEPEVLIDIAELNDGHRLEFKSLDMYDSNGDGIKEPITLYRRSIFGSGVTDGMLLQAYLDKNTISTATIALNPNQALFVEDAMLTDLNQDGQADVLLLTRGSDNNITLSSYLSSFSEGVWRMVQNQQWHYGQGQLGKIKVANLDGNNYPDILEFHQDTTQWDRTTRIYMNDLTGHFSSEPDSSIDGCIYDFWLADMDNDGDDDLFCRMTTQAALYSLENPGNGIFNQTKTNILNNADLGNQLQLQFFDVDGDQDKDILIPKTEQNTLLWAKNTWND